MKWVTGHVSCYHYFDHMLWGMWKCKRSLPLSMNWFLAGESQTKLRNKHHKTVFNWLEWPWEASHSTLHFVEFFNVHGLFDPHNISPVFTYKKVETQNHCLDQGINSLQWVQKSKNLRNSEKQVWSKFIKEGFVKQWLENSSNKEEDENISGWHIDYNVSRLSCLFVCLFSRVVQCTAYVTI